MEHGNYAEVCVNGFMMDRGGFLEAAERRKRKGAFPHSGCTRLFITIAHTALTSVELLLDNFAVMRIFSGTFET